MRMISVPQRLAAVSISLALAALVLAGCQSTDDRDQVPAPTSADTGSTSDTILLPGNTGTLAMTVARDGSLWVTEQRISAVARIDPAGQVAQYRIPGDSEPKGILQAPDDTIWYAGDDQTKRIDTSGRTNGWMEDDGGLGYPKAITLGPDGAIWYDETGSPALIRRIAPSRGPSTVAALPDGWTPGGMASGPDGAVWFCEHEEQHDADAIGHMTPQGTYTSWPLPPGSYSWTIVAGPDGALWFTEVHESAESPPPASSRTSPSRTPNTRGPSSPARRARSGSPPKPTSGASPRQAASPPGPCPTPNPWTASPPIRTAVSGWRIHKRA
ncbi:hypothetical protein ACFV1W_22870 [Kitasatospora sp. NPDC059648]|uniref:Vgb family protein n=1 Tax=Kitasatospora sp. NPDC059648 TaxID=3346894 RepID=UPI0036B42D4E